MVIAMTKYRTRDGDVLDDICWKHYGKQSKAVEIVLEANRDLADYGKIMPAGIVITLPELPPIPKKQPIRLWD